MAVKTNSTPFQKALRREISKKALGLFSVSLQIKMPKGSGLTKAYKLSPELSDVVGKKEATRGECMKQLWAYIKEHKLQDPENKQYFKPDKKMAKIFGEDKLRGFGMAKYLKDHLS